MSLTVSQRIDHAGYQRYIIHQNPPRFDEDGDLVDDDDDDEDDEEPNGSPDEDNPYEETKIERTRNHTTLRSS